MAQASLFTGHPRVRTAVETARQCADKDVSDIIDNDGHQYVDLVMEGGGVLGIALVGYTYVLEQAGIRFLGVGGTSAGSINALMIAALGTPAEEKSEKLVEVLANMPLKSFIDGDSDARDFSSAVMERAPMMKLLWKAIQVVDNLQDDLGLNPGKAFMEWLTTELLKANVLSTDDLRRKLASIPPSIRIRGGIRDHHPLAFEEKTGRLAMVAADVTTETKVELPRMAGLYWAEPDKINPACFARASMSIPFFFHPYRVQDCPPNQDAQWKIAGYCGPPPQEVIFIDGGIMSNFPINLFHETNVVPIAPTFGVKIGVDDAAPAKITKPAQLFSAIFDAARHTLDDDFIVTNPDYRQLVTMIDTEPHHWLNFHMTYRDKVDLFARGAEAAAQFLCGFNWEKYKATRKGIAEAYRMSSGT